MRDSCDHEPVIYAGRSLDIAEDLIRLKQTSIMPLGDDMVILLDSMTIIGVP